MNVRSSALIAGVLLAVAAEAAVGATEVERELLRLLGAHLSGACMADPMAGTMKADTVDAKLLAAAHCGDIEEVRKLLGAGASVRARQTEERNKGRTALHYAAGGGLYARAGRHVEVAKLLVARSADVNAAAEGGYTPLHVAAGLGQREMVEFLLNQGANVNAEDIRGTPIEAAVGNAHADVVELLLQRKADTRGTLQALPSSWAHPQVKRILTRLLEARVDLNQPDRSRRIPIDSALDSEEKALLLLSRGARLEGGESSVARRFHLLIARNYQKAVKLVLAGGYDVRTAESDGSSSVHHAAYAGPAMMGMLLAQGGRLDERDSKGDQPIHYAVRGDKPDMVDYLLKKGVSANAEGADGATPIMVLGINFRSEGMTLAKLLLAAGANVNQRDNRGYSALDVASPPLIPVLIENGAKVKATDIEGHTALHRARQPGRIPLLVSAGADVNAVTRNGRTPLHMSDRWASNAYEMVAAFVSLGANVEARDADGATPLHRAATNDYWAVRALTRAGAAIEARDRQGKTPLHYSAMGVAQVTIDLLAAGANVNARDIDGNTPLHDAVRRNNKLVAESLLKGGADQNARNKNGQTPFAVAEGAASK